MAHTTSPLQLTADALLQAAMVNNSALFDQLADTIITGIHVLKQRRPAMRGWMLGKHPNGEGVLAYRTNRYGLQCTDICAKTWAVVDYRSGKPKFHSLLGN